MARRHGSMRALVEALAALFGEAGDAAPAAAASPAQVMRARAAISEYFLSTDTVSVDEAAELWPRLQALACRAYAATRTAEAAMLAENLPGLVLWRLRHDWAEDPTDGVDRLAILLDIMNGEAGVYMLSHNNLRISAKFGPTSMHRLAGDWIETFRQTLAAVAERTPRALLSAQQLEPVDSFSKPLVSKKFELLYDMPFVQEGLRVVARRANWMTPFWRMLQQMRNPSLAPLTRALFALALVDAHFPRAGAGAHGAAALTAYFRELVQHIDDRAFVPVTEVNATPRTAYEVRVSSALAHQDPYTTDTRAGTVAERLRTDPGVIDFGALLSSGALAIHATAVAKLLASDARDDVSKRARARVAEHAENTWETIQASTSPAQVADALVGAGFTATHCGVLERALLDRFARLRGSGEGDAGGEGGLDDTQQAVGCVAIVGGMVFKLLRSYGYGLDYIREYTTTLSTLEPAYSDLLAALGLPDKGLEQTLRRSMAPRPLMSHVSAARAALDEELRAVEKRAGGPGTHSAAREALLTWFDFRARDLWGVRVPEGDHHSPQGLAPITASIYSDDDLVAAAARIRFGSADAPPAQVMFDPSFAPYLLATVVLDAHHAIVTARFSPEPLARALRVLTWARDYGTGAVANVDGYRTKLTAIIASLSPYLQKDAPTPTVAHAGNVESLLGELHAAVAGAIALIPERARMPTPERPSVRNSAFLAGLFLTAVHKRLEALVAHTAELAESVLGATASVVEAIVTLSRFFSCRLAAVLGHQAVSVHPPAKQAPSLGTWRLVDLVDAVGSLYNEVGDRRADLRADVITLRSDMSRATEALQECEALATQTEGTPFGRYFTPLLARHTQLTRTQTALAIKAGKLLGGAEAPGLKHVSRFLQRWGAVSASYQKATSGEAPEAHIQALAADLRRVWDEIQEERATTPPRRSFSRRELEAAVERLMGGYSEVLDDEGSSTGLSRRANIASWADVNMDALRKRVTIPADIDATRGDASLASRAYVPREDLLAEIDAIFNSTKQ
ncbi:tegument protein UL37 [Equid alphaherpesvirus 3]|uniref:Tegument protein UL37 n=1 Tax=Equid alphaherpesvirus 3 TaxID=80341 RepID=A0A077B5X7_9ALPH|nr:tegument protein UL37 [Equid alphaherpesvirus 3]AIL02940.1 tegument protein UL37 [Equid alphaherpesvirus 3]